MYCEQQRDDGNTDLFDKDVCQVWLQQLYICVLYVIFIYKSKHKNIKRDDGNTDLFDKHVCQVRLLQLSETADYIQHV